MFSCQKVGECYRLGLGIEQNDTLAFEWYMRAAEQNFRVAQKSVGDCYFNGCGVEQNDMLAFQWYLQSAERGFPAAQLVVGVVTGKGEGWRKTRQKL